MPFTVPTINDNEDSWGPNASLVEGKHTVPYAPFRKTDKLGRISDWQASHQQYSRNRRGEVPVVNEAFLFKDSTSSEFKTVVESSKKTGGYTGQRRFHLNQQYSISNRIRREKQAANQKQVRGKAAKHLHKTSNGRRQKLARMRYASYRRWGQNDTSKVELDRSVLVNETWEQVDEISFKDLGELPAYAEESVPQAENLESVGMLSVVHPKWRQVQAKRTVPLTAKFSGTFPPHVTASQDPVLKRLAEQPSSTSSSSSSSSSSSTSSEQQEPKLRVFTTDVVLAALMACRRSVLPFDVMATKRNGSVFFDIRPGSHLERHTNDETSPELLSGAGSEESKGEKSGIDKPESLMLEATVASANFVHQTTQQQQQQDQRIPVGKLEQGSPFPHEAQLSRAYRYRRFFLEDSAIEVNVRCQLDCVGKRGEETTLMTSHGILETYTSRQNDMIWRQKLDTQQSAIVTSQLKGNAFKFARWSIEAMLAGADRMLLGFLSRTTLKNNANHSILAVSQYNPDLFAHQLHISLRHLWSLFEEIAERIGKLDDGRFVLLREPNQDLFTVFSVPESESFVNRSIINEITVDEDE